ncbi:MAG: cell division protein ZipA [Gammaproteobacteria bacterium]|nr:cell division protein ZipA [Gammaproteobacteria bacterium]
MDMKEWIIIGGSALIGLIVLNGLIMAWWRSRDPLRMKIQPDLLPDDLDEDAWLAAELPNGGARIVAVEASDGEAADADEGIPVLLETEDPGSVDGAGQAADADLATHAEDSAALAGNPLPDLPPIVPERGLRPVREESPTPSVRVEVEPDADEPHLDAAGPDADDQPLGQALPVDLEPETETALEAAASRDDANPVAEPDAGPLRQDAVDDLLVIHLVAPQDEIFSGDALVSALRAQELRFGDMDIFHRLDADTGEAVFSVVRAVEPGSFDLTRIQDCASPGLMVFLRLPSHGDAQEAVAQMMRAAEAMADDLGGELLDENRKPFTALSAEGYRRRAMGLAGRQVAFGPR